MTGLDPLVILAVGVLIVLGMIIVLKVNAFISLITAAIAVSLLAPGEVGDKISRVATAFGKTTGDIGIVIAMAAVIGKCMLDSGAADRVVRAFLRIFGEKRSPFALMGSGFVLAVPVFFDTVFYLLVPLARSLHRKTGKQYLKYILAIGAGGAITHTLVPPTPGPLMMASNLGFDIGVMIMVGTVVAVPAALVGLLCAGVADRLMNTPMRQIGNEPEPEPLEDSQLPSLLMSLLPVVLPVVLISTNTVMTTLADNDHAALLAGADLPDLPALRAEIRRQDAEDKATPGKRIVERIEKEGARDAARREQLVALLQQPQPLDDEQQAALIDGLNRYIVADKDFHDERSYLGILLPPAAKSLLRNKGVRMKAVDAERMNRLLLEAALNTEERTLIEPLVWETPLRKAANVTSLFGNANLALLISTVIALWVLVRQRKLTRSETAQVVETSLMSGGVIILITAGGGAFGAMLEAAQIGDAIQSRFSDYLEAESAALVYLAMGFLIAMVLKIAQGSSTVAMIIGSSMIAAIVSTEDLTYHPVYLATAIGGGSLVGSWMNDSGFWIFAKMGGLTEGEALKSWTVILSLLGIVTFAVTWVLAQLMPLV